MTRSSKKLRRTVKLAKSVKRGAFADGGAPWNTDLSVNPFEYKPSQGSDVPLANMDLYKGAALNTVPKVLPKKEEDAAPEAPEQYSPEGGGGGDGGGGNDSGADGEAGSDSDSDGGGSGSDGSGGDWRGGAITARRYCASGGPINLTRKNAKPAKHPAKKSMPPNALINKALGVVSKKT